MDYATFLRRFGASVRTKNIVRPSDDPDDPKKINKRPHRLPDSSEIPKEFIRLDPWEAEYLFLLGQRSRQGIVETGRFHGGSTFVLSCSNDKVPIWSIDIDPKDDDHLLSILASKNIGSNVELIIGDSQNVRYGQIKQFDLLFIDGDHSYEGCMADLKNWFPLLSRGGHVIIHDSYYGQPVMDAVNDFTLAAPNQMIIPAFRCSSHWWHHAGSMAHFIKL